MTDLATLTTYLTEAQAALHDLATGQQLAEVTHRDRTHRWSRANMADLRRYIEDLKSQIIAMGGSVDTTGYPRAPIVFTM